MILVDFILSQLPKPFMSVMHDLVTKGDRAAESALYLEAERIMTLAKMRTPVDTGLLRSTGVVQLPVSRGGEIEVRMGFGGFGADYALIVHEDMDVYHTVGQAKFLQIPTMEEVLSGRSASYIQQTITYGIGG